jgi:hypothetical protein
MARTPYTLPNLISGKSYRHRLGGGAKIRHGSMILHTRIKHPGHIKVPNSLRTMSPTAGHHNHIGAHPRKQTLKIHMPKVHTSRVKI